jgi:hypothetical protein
MEHGIMTRQYNHDPRHWRFSRRIDHLNGYAIEDCGPSRRADRLVFWCAVAIVVLLMVAL